MLNPKIGRTQSGHVKKKICYLSFFLMYVSSRSFAWYPFCYYNLTFNVKPYFSQSCQKSQKKFLRLYTIIIVPLERSQIYSFYFTKYKKLYIFVVNTLFDILDHIVFLLLYKIPKIRFQLYKYT